MNESLATRITRYNKMNLLIVFLQTAAWFGMISLLHYDLAWYLQVAIIFVFCTMMQGVFSIMHESFHSMAHTNPKLNWFIGWLGSTLFGTSYTLFAINHQGHHARNRTRPELVDYIYPDESAAKKITAYYFAIIGGIWLMSFIGSLVLPLLPFSAIRYLVRTKRDNTYAAAFEEFTPKTWNRMRLEVLASVLFWIAIIMASGWSWKVLLLCYVCFAFSWSSLQWVYHIRTPIHVVEGAYNLRLPTWMRLLFLNFNYNLTHHRESFRHWQELYAVSNQSETQPLWYRYLGIFYWPQPLPQDPSVIQKKYF